MAVKKQTSVSVPAKIGAEATEITLETVDNKTVVVTLSNEIIATIGPNRTLTIELTDLRDAVGGLTNYGNIITEAFKNALGGEKDSLFKTNNGLGGIGGAFGSASRRGL